MPKPRKPTDAPATKADIRMLMSEIGKLYDANQGWKEELKGHFDLAVENIRADLIGANKDKIANHDHRLGRLEKHTGMSV